MILFPNSYSLKTASILIIDDDSDLRETLNILLSPYVGTLYTAKDASIALNILEGHKIDIAIIDLRMPGKHGFDLLNDIKSKYPETINIILTAHGNKDDVIEALRNSAFDFIDKPFEEEYLIERLKKAMEVKLLSKLNIGPSSFSKIIEDILSHMKEENCVYRENIAINIERNLIPLIKQIKSSKEFDNLSNSLHNNINLIEQFLIDLNTGFFKEMENLNLKLKLSPTENRVCYLIKAGHQTKEISDILHISENTTKAHIKHIRKKMGITNNKITLKNYLNNLT